MSAGVELRQLQPLQVAVHAHLRRRVGRDVQVRPVHLDHRLQQFRQCGHISSSPVQSHFTVSRTTSSIVVTPSFTLRRPLMPQRDHPFVDRLAPQLEARGADENQLAQLLADFHHFVEADAALVAGVVARSQPAPFIGVTVVGVLLR